MKKIFSLVSEIEGKGLFIGEDAKKGERIAHIKGEFKRKINKTIDDVLSNPDWIGQSRQTWIDPAVPFKYLNHSCEPNIGIRGKVTIVALRDIKKDEELTFDYSTTEVDPRWKLPAECNCGTASCRKIIGSLQTLPKNYTKKCIKENIIPRGIKMIAQTIV